LEAYHGFAFNSERRRAAVLERSANMDWKSESGKIGYILLWLLGVPIPILLLIFVLRGCT
jgi:hypothetical protein